MLLTLTRIEFALLRLLLIHQPEPVPRERLLQVWDELVNPKSNVLEGKIAQLRKKLRDPAMIHTVRGYGYRIAPA